MNRLFFIVGSSRSGTTLLARALKRHTAVHVLNETHIFNETAAHRWQEPLDDQSLQAFFEKLITIQRLGYYNKNEPCPDMEYCARLVHSVIRLAEPTRANAFRLFSLEEGVAQQKTIVGDQTPRNVYKVGEILNVFPDSRFIVMIRDPRAVVASQKNKWKAAERFGQPPAEVSRARWNYHPITMAILWKKSIRAGLLAAGKYPERVLRVRFEELIATPERTLRRVCRHLGITFDPSMLEVSVEMTSHKDREGTAGFDKDANAHWEYALSKGEIGWIERICIREMNDLGYSPAKLKVNWLSEAWELFRLPPRLIVNLWMNRNRYVGALFGAIRFAFINK